MSSERITLEDIPLICRMLGEVHTRQELADMLYVLAGRYTLHDLQLLRGAIERELVHVPEPYRSRLYPKLMEQVFGTHHMLIAMVRDGYRFNGRVGPTLEAYCEMVERACLNGASPLHPRLLLLYYLLAAFLMFVLRVPAHPPGTPFPGGGAVRVRGDAYYCPVREKEDEVEGACCRFCPAKQDESV